jgi:hypothetical protein
MAHFFPGWYDETSLENQEWQIKYGLRAEFIDLLITENITPEQRHRLDILHHGTEEQIKQLSETKET